MTGVLDRKTSPKTSLKTSSLLSPSPLSTSHMPGAVRRARICRFLICQVRQLAATLGRDREEGPWRYELRKN